MTGEILRDKFLNHKKMDRLLKFTLNKISDVEQRLFAVEVLYQKNNKESLKILDDFLKVSSKKRTKNHKKDRLPEKIFTLKFHNSIGLNILQICENIILRDYYVIECGYVISYQEGHITLLNCEGKGISQISEIKGLSKLANLEHLLLQRNKIIKIEGLEDLKKLKILNLSKNEISEIQNLTNLTNLEELDLSYNKINKIENLDSLEKLKVLSLENNKIKEIQNLENLTGL